MINEIKNYLLVSNIPDVYFQEDTIVVKVPYAYGSTGIAYCYIGIEEIEDKISLLLETLDYFSYKLNRTKHGNYYNKYVIVEMKEFKQKILLCILEERFNELVDDILKERENVC